MFGGLVQTRYFCTRFRKRKQSFNERMSRVKGMRGVTIRRVSRSQERLETASRKKLRKKFSKNLEDMLKTPYLCNRFHEKRERQKE